MKRKHSSAGRNFYGYRVPERIGLFTDGENPHPLSRGPSLYRTRARGFCSGYFYASH
jgi:hypothetical protein